MAKKARFGPITAADLTRKLESDPEWVARRDAREREHQKLVELNRIDERPLVEDLNQAGVHVRSIDDLVNTDRPYPRAIPILLEHFQLPHNNDVRKAIVRAMTVKEARGIVPPQLLLDEFKRLEDSGENSVKALIASAFVGLADDSYYDQIVELLDDRSHGKARWPLPLALTWMKVRREDAIIQLLELLQDDDGGIRNSAIEALGHMRDPKTASYLQRFLNDPDSYVRSLAKRAVAKIERARSRKK